MSTEDLKNWWEQKRSKYNIGLILSGALAYIAIFIIEGHKNFNLFALIFQGIAFWSAIGLANLLYFLGPFTDRIFNRHDSPRFRMCLFDLGFGFSILIPFSLPLMFIIFPTWDYGYELINNNPSENEIVGVYELTPSSKEFLIHQGYNIDSSRLELLTDNKYYFHKLPDNILNGFGTSNKKTINQNGKWMIYCGNGDNCQIEIENASFVDIAKKNDRLSILITIGDPDSREGLVYEKSSIPSKK